MTRWLIVALAILPHCTGCLYYAYPTVSHVPDLTVPNPDGSVHAFRVDIDRTERAPQPLLTQYTLSRLPIDSHGQIPGQLEVAATTGVLNPLGVTEAGQHERSQYTMVVRLYRPGSRTQEVKSWEKTRNLNWIPAPDLLAQEQAIDDLLAVPATPDQPVRGTWWDLKNENTPRNAPTYPAESRSPTPLGLQPGTISWEHRKTLQFAASEYQRLAGSPVAAAPNMQAARDRMRAKAQWLNSYADQPPAEAR